MPKKQKAKAKGNQQKAKNRNSLPKQFVPQSRDGDSTPRPHFTLKDELTNTGRHHSAWSPTVKLRDQKITFVSAGPINPSDEAHDEAPFSPQDMSPKRLQAPQFDGALDSDLDGSEGAMAHMNLQSGTEAVVSDADHHITEQANMASGEVDSMQVDAGKEEDEQPMFFIDTAGDISLAATGPAHRFRSHSPTPSDSSDEIILFRGRQDPVIIHDDPSGTTASTTKQASQPVSHSVPQSASQPTHVTDALLDALDDVPEPKRQARPHTTNQIQTRSQAKNQVKDEVQNGMGWGAVPARYRGHEVEHWVHADGKKGIPSGTAVPDDDVSVDAPASLDNGSDVAEEGFISAAPPGPRKSKRSRKRQNRKLRMQADLDEELMQDYIANMDGDVGILNRTDRLGSETEEVWDTTDDDEDMSEEAEKAIDKALDAANDDDSSSASPDTSMFGSDDEDDEDDEEEEGDDTDLENELIYTEREQWMDEDDLRQRQRDAMTDEEIARILAKQEELGISGDELQLYDDSGFGDLDTARAALEAFSGYGGRGAQRRSLPRRAKGGRKSDFFPDATLMADVIEADPYGGFDIMDFDRPSLRPKAKGRKSAGVLPEELGLSDDELIQDLQNAWANDRSKKKSKKAEREELRTLGLLNTKGKNGKANLGQKYLQGITMHQIKSELIEFLDTGHTTQAFPPMAKADRKVLHEIAAKFNLNSKSQGSGKNRFTILVKTQRTLDWSEERWNAVQNRSNKGFLPNMKAKSSKKGPVAKRGGQGGGFSNAATSYANGAVVGGNAPEIAESSFGRKLMEKMGWAKGMALGKEGEGEGRLLVPVEARIRSGKAGLG